jgi:hypothetical protein
VLIPLNRRQAMRSARSSNAHHRGRQAMAGISEAEHVQLDSIHMMPIPTRLRR